MQNQTVRLGECSFEILGDNGLFVGLGKVSIGDTVVRSGRLPLTCYFETYLAWRLTGLKLGKVQANDKKVVINLTCVMQRKDIAQMRDHSFDPIHNLADWDGGLETREGATLKLVITPAAEDVEGTKFAGFAYHWEYSTEDEELKAYWMLDKATWELDGDCTGATVISQSSCSPPEFTFDKSNTWTTEAGMYWTQPRPDENYIMTHNLPRWASHGSFDFQFKGNKTLIGVFERVDLIRTTMLRDAGKPELKCFDKHMFDNTKSYKTSAKAILLNSDAKTTVDNRNLWTWLQDIVHGRARAEFGLKEEECVSWLSQNYWRDFTMDTYYRDLLPAAVSLGVESVFVDNLNESDLTCGLLEKLDGVPSGNMCCGQEYKPAKSLGGTKKLKQLVERFNEAGVRLMSWTNNDQSNFAAITQPMRKDSPTTLKMFVTMEDARTRYGGAYTNVFIILDMANPDARKYFVDAWLKINQETGQQHIFFDSFYNLGFMPINYTGLNPRTQWRGMLEVYRKLQEAGFTMRIESFGAFGYPLHGCHNSFATPGLEYVSYKTGPGFGYATVPDKRMKLEEVEMDKRYYQYLAHMVLPSIPLFKDGKRADQLAGDIMRRGLKDYRNNRQSMVKRFLQEDGKSVLWHDASGKRATLWNFADRSVKLGGSVTDLSTGEKLPKAEKYKLKAYHTYAITGGKLPTAV